MLRVTAEAFHEKLNAREEDIILNGPPGRLKGFITISNENDDTLKVRSLPVKNNNEQYVKSKSQGVLQVWCSLLPGEEKTVPLLHQVHPQTAPGTYESMLVVGGAQRKISIVVQEHIEINIQPTSFTFTGTEPGKVHNAEITLTNLGNIPFQVPQIKHAAVLDMDMVCRAVGIAMRSEQPAGYEQVLDSISKNIQENLPDWANAGVEESGITVEPGNSLLLHFTLTMPRNCDVKKDYSGDLRLWNKNISYLVKSYSTIRPQYNPQKK